MISILKTIMSAGFDTKSEVIFNKCPYWQSQCYLVNSASMSETMKHHVKVQGTKTHKT